MGRCDEAMTRSAPPASDRMVFRAWREGDLECFHTLCSDPQVMRHVGDGRAWSRERTAEFIASAGETLRRKGYCQWALIHKADRQLIGYCGFVASQAEPEIGWRLSPRYWGRGLATEAARAALRHGFETLGFQRVLATVQEGNVASIRVVEKLGMQPLGRFRRSGRAVLLFSATKD